MSLSDLSPLSYFKELQLLPRVIFTIGGALFFGGLFIKEWRVLLFGVGLVLVSVGYNFLFDLYYNDPVPPHVTRFSWLNLFQGLLALVLGAFALYIVVYNYRHGFLPTFLQPIPR